MRDTYLLKEDGGLPRALLLTLAIVAGITVANLYYNQALLNMMRHDLGVTEFKANLIAMATQIGYAGGLLFIVPLGDLYQRKRIILVNFSLLTVSLLVIALSHNIYLTLAASLFTGICSVVPQIFIPIASQFSRPENKGRNVGLVITGLLIGILGSRVISGFVGKLLGWREMYFIAAALMLVCGLVVMRMLPSIQPNFAGKYGELMRSLVSLLKEFPQLRIFSVRAGLNFGSFLALWACLAFKMGQAPFFADSHVVGLLGLCGIAGALTATFVGSYVRRVGVRRFNLIGGALFLSAWLFFWAGADSYATIVVGIILIDIGMQCVQLSNQTSLMELSPRAVSRMNTIFMTTYFLGGAAGTFLSGTFWQFFGWNGVVGVGVLLTLLSLLITVWNKK
ncbi:MAG: MFS transporter [Mediterranea sp.]|jgi:predicted MFS family arabinose efflux permease|nr:MFS transporter [Mediterranea sp.]